LLQQQDHCEAWRRRRKSVCRLLQGKIQVVTLIAVA
jgi:hypothetical protein